MESYQELKLWMVNALHLSKDSIHNYIGILALILTAFLCRRNGITFVALLPGLLLSILMELWDIHDTMVSGASVRWADSIKDILNTNGLPVLIVACVRLGYLRWRGTSR